MAEDHFWHARFGGLLCEHAMSRVLALAHAQTWAPTDALVTLGIKAQMAKRLGLDSDIALVVRARRHFADAADQGNESPCNSLVAIFRNGHIDTVAATRWSQCDFRRVAKGFQSPEDHFQVRRVL